MNSEVSSNYLYHFTRKLETIQNILNDNVFKPFYCLERLDYLAISNENGNPHEMAFPMVCFCDLTEDKQLKHREKFGSYCICLSKEWGYRKFLTPVTYCSDRTLSAVSLNILTKHANEIKNIISNEQFNKFRNSLSILLMHFKSYEGYEYSKELKSFKREKTKFYDEREWRYLPLEVHGLNWHLSRDQFENKLLLKEENLKIQEKNCLSFRLSDIFHIQLMHEKEIDVLINNLVQKYSEEELLTLKGKIKIVNNQEKL